MKLPIRKCNPHAKIPQYAHPGDAGLDLFSVEQITLKPGERVGIKTGISLEIPMGYVGLIWDKSGLAIKGGLKTCGGVIDAVYRGEILVGIANFSDKEYTFDIGDKIAQLLIQKVETVDCVEILEHEPTMRGDKGFGSSGK